MAGQPSGVDARGRGSRDCLRDGAVSADGGLAITSGAHAGISEQDRPEACKGRGAPGVTFDATDRRPVRMAGDGPGSRDHLQFAAAEGARENGGMGRELRRSWRSQPLRTTVRFAYRLFTTPESLVLGPTAAGVRKLDSNSVERRRRA